MPNPNINKPIPMLYERKEDCCGCTACYAICPTSSISMVEDEEGFLYPVIDEEKCIRCEMCLKVCPIKVEYSDGGNRPDRRLVPTSPG